MKRLSPLFFVPLGLALALPMLGAAPRKKPQAKRSKPAASSVRTYRHSRIQGYSLAPTNLLTMPSSLSDDEQGFVRLVNEERAQRGLSQLTIDPVLVAAARQHSREMSEQTYFDHYSPVRGLRTPLDRYGVALGSRRFTCTVGENLFYSSRRDVNLGHASLMKSPGHKANIVAPDYKAIGVGVYLSPDGQYYVTQMYHT